MKILQICNKPPYPPHEGGSIAMHSLTMGLLKAGHQVKVLAVSSFKNNTNSYDLPQWYLDSTKFESVFIDLQIKPWDAFINLFSNKSYHVQRFISKQFSNKIKEIILAEEFDIIQLETLFLAPYIDEIRKYSQAKIILRSHNIEHLIWERIADKTKNLFKKHYLKHLCKTLKNYELKAISKFDGIAAITRKDAMFFKKTGCKIPIIDISFGIDIEDYPYYFAQENTELFHIGAMNWIPNQEGLKWFLDNVWKLITDELPDLVFCLAGRKMPEWFIESKMLNLNVIGEVENAKDFISSKGIMIVPLFSGSGIRIKIIEAMAMGKVVITTKIGAEGINIIPNENILIANTAEEFKSAVFEAVSDGSLRKRIAENARFLIEREHDNNMIIKSLISFYIQILKENKV